MQSSVNLYLFFFLIMRVSQSIVFHRSLHHPYLYPLDHQTISCNWMHVWCEHLSEGGQLHLQTLTLPHRISKCRSTFNNCLLNFQLCTHFWNWLSVVARHHCRQQPPSGLSEGKVNGVSKLGLQILF